MKKNSAGILPYRFLNSKIEFCICHPGGPFYKNKDEGIWTIAKGEFEEDEDILTAAKREFLEETGVEIKGDFQALTSVKQKSNKTIHVWAIESNFDADKVKSNTFSLEWPPKSGIINEYPEIDRACWFETNTTLKKLHPGQIPFVIELLKVLNIIIPETKSSDLGAQLDMF